MLMKFHQKKISKQKVVGTQCLAKNIFRSFSPTIDSPDCRQKYIEKSPNLCVVRQALFARKSFSSCLHKKP